MTDSQPLLPGVVALLTALLAVVAFVVFAPLPQRDDAPAPPPAVQPDAGRQTVGGLRTR